MKWGEPWGICSLWGVGSGDGPKQFCEDAECRVLIQMDDTATPAPGNRKFRDFICILVEGLGHYADVTGDVGRAFDLDTAVGEQLDFIGAVLGLPRQGFPDSRYRVFLSIQRDLILSATRDEANWTGTHNNILTIARTFVGGGFPTITLTPLPPYSFQLDIPGIVLSELLILANFICVALYAGVLGFSTFILAPDSVWDSDSVAVPGAGVWCSDSVPIVPCATWSLTIAIGSQPC